MKIITLETRRENISCRKIYIKIKLEKFKHNKFSQ